ncbi:hypothetical protein [Burkholderia orbicola]|uniref:hypothetical protein n=1 Tax=Burkholderia orbicola TaxID=2978683 RepID=UPI002FDF0DEF
MKIIMQRRYLLALSAVTLLTLGACSKHSSQPDSSPASAPGTAASSPAAQQPASADQAADHPDEAGENVGAKPQQSAASSYGPQIKGIALGESPDEVRQALNALLPIGNPCQVSTDAVRVVCEGTAQRLQGSFTYESGRLSSFKFYSAFTSLAFGRMPFNDFTQNFMKAYNIPRMDPAQDNPALSQYLRYRDDSGWEAGIYPDNTFYVRSVATAAQQAKSFN